MLQDWRDINNVVALSAVAGIEVYPSSMDALPKRDGQPMLDPHIEDDLVGGLGPLLAGGVALPLGHVAVALFVEHSRAKPLVASRKAHERLVYADGSGLADVILVNKAAAFLGWGTDGVCPLVQGVLMAETVAEKLALHVRGELIDPTHSEYDVARAVYNGMIDRRPEVIVRACDEADVVATVRAAADMGKSLAVRGGGHSVPGYGTCDGVVLDLGALRNVNVDPAGKTVRVGGGARLGDLDHATHPFGLATPAGFVAHTGLGGLTLGGGVGYLSRRFGLTCDNLLSARVVTADGRLVTASADENPDLFWALRGGGGNFGVVTSFEFRLHPVDQIVGGPIFFELEAAADVLGFFTEHFPAAPRELGGFFGFQIAPPLPFIPQERHGDTCCILVVCWTGDPAKADEILRPIRSAGPVVAEHVGQMPFPTLQGAFDPLLPPGLRQYWKSDFLDDVPDAAIAAHFEHGPRVPTVTSTMHIYPIDGAVQEMAADATAYANRDARFLVNIVGTWSDEADDEKNTAWVRDYYAAVHPFSGFDGGYTNFMAADDEGRVRANYGPGYDRLTDAKRTWDPENLFRLNQNIEPAGG